MQSIGRKANVNESTTQVVDALGAQVGVSGESVVLPKILRKPVRHMNRLVKGGFKVSQASVATCGVGLVLVLAAAGVFSSGEQNVVSAQMNAFNVLKIEHYDISGNSELGDVDAVHILSPKNGESLFGYDVVKARENLRANPWVSDASVTKVYPNKIAVNIEERSASAVWHHNEEVMLIDREGRSLSKYDGRNDGLPVVVGKGAAEASSSLLASLDRYPDIATRVTTHIRVGDRRWDLEMDNNVRVMLPELGVDTEIHRLAVLNEEKGLLERDVETIDMRFPDRLVLKLGDDAAKVRAVAIEEQKNVLKTAKDGRQL